MAKEVKQGFGWGLMEDRVCVKQDAQEKKSKGGIIIPDTADQEKATKGEIIELGPFVNHDKETGEAKKGPHLFVGQRVFYGKYAGTEIDGEDGEKYIIMRVMDILGIKP